MGILDDAIREHLELKRKHGVAEDELQRQEEEALGPARRDVVPADAEHSDGASEVGEGDGTHGHEEAGPVAGEAVAEGEPAASEPPVEEAHPPVAGEPSPAEPGAQEPLVEEPGVEEPLPEAQPAEPPPAEAPLAQEPFVREPALDGPEHEPEPGSPADTPSRGFEAFDEPEADEEPEPVDDADVLEDTPDFLQETPEHDRLWFEQKPPRDFDFD
jgi:hypothetical protein